MSVEHFSRNHFHAVCVSMCFTSTDVCVNFVEVEANEETVWHIHHIRFLCVARSSARRMIHSRRFRGARAHRESSFAPKIETNE